jgi:hypothetical protein
MEHDDEIIRRKVRGLESEPVVLDRERLWSSIAFPASRREPRSLIYYAAASVALAWALVFLFQELSRRDELQVRLLELELSIHSQSTLVSIAASVAPTEVPCEASIAVDSVIPQKRIIHRQPKVNQSAPKTLVAEVQDPAPLTISDKPIVEEHARMTEPVVASKQPEAKPRVVLGSVLPDNAPTTQGQRLRLRLFREDENPTTPGAPLITLAGVNNQ